MSEPNRGRSEEPVIVLDGVGESCATFTPTVAARMKEMAPGDRLEVVSDDASAPDALSSWARLTGNDLVEAREEEDGRYRFVLMRC
jgi:TusA-related sulfurtransferase